MKLRSWRIGVRLSSGFAILLLMLISVVVISHVKRRPLGQWLFCEPLGISGAVDISAYGGWRAYLTGVMLIQ